VPFPFSLTGAWIADDGATYYLRHMPDDTVTWAGLQNSGFHRGMGFTNVFQGKISSISKTADGVTGVLSGAWVDVPCGENNGSGTLTVNIAATLPRPGVPLAIALQQKPGGNSGFGAQHWKRGGPENQLGPQDTFALLSNVNRFDKPMAENNPPCRDFTVMWGTIGPVSGPTLPPASDYCSFRGMNGGWNGDGDFDFDLENVNWSLMEPDFWTTGWLPIDLTVPPLHATGASQILALYTQFNAHFHCEAPMYGRQNAFWDCSGPPKEGVPGWMEMDGDSVLINGRPINGRLEVVPVPAPPGGKAGEILRFAVGVGGKQVIEIKQGHRVRVTGVVATDPSHFLDSTKPPEIHPVYAMDIIQDFTARAPTSNVNLTGVWHGSDMGTYYVRQIGSTVWWLGLSRDQGRSNANVFRGTISGSTIQGAWVDVPIGRVRTLTSGHLTLNGSPLSTELIETTLSGFPVNTWVKMYDTPTGGPINRLPVAAAKAAAVRRRRKPATTRAKR
jgi:hypothetical protein